MSRQAHDDWFIEFVFISSDQVSAKYALASVEKHTHSIEFEKNNNITYCSVIYFKSVVLCSMLFKYGKLSNVEPLSILGYKFDNFNIF